MQYTLYMLRCSDNTLYTGITTDLTRRIKEHNSDNKKGAKYTKARRPVEVVYSKVCENRAEASSQEYRVKRLTRIQKEGLIRSVE